MIRARLVCLATFVAAAAIVQASGGDDKKETKGKNHEVVMIDNYFQVDGKKGGDITIKVGDTITWVSKKSNDNNHTATAKKKDDPNYFDTKDVKPGESSKPVEFKKEGKVEYHCEHHPNTMTGTITVKP